MAGNNDRIHGYNAIYRTADVQINFFSFELNQAGRPQNFINRPVAIIGGGPAALDHQGHIVPQNTLNLVLNPRMADMAAACHDLNQTIDYIAAGPAWMQAVYDYGDEIGAPMFDFDEGDPEDRLGGFFSIVTWNPINICRAPDDARRGGAPGDNIDQQVVDYLAAHQVPQGVVPAWLASLNNLIPNPANVVLIEDYITECSNTLAAQLAGGIGYYAFPWQNNGVILLPE